MDDLHRSIAEVDRRCLLALDLVRVIDGRYVPRARIDRVDGLLIASDLRLRKLRPEFVLGPGPTSSLLWGFVRPSAGAALDLGCGSGVLALRLAVRGASVEAIDINPRAVAFTRFNATLNELSPVAAVVGDYLGEGPDPRRDRRFETIVANTPFVLAPRRELLYRDRPLPGDASGSMTVDRVVRGLLPGGRGYVLCQWADRGGDWAAPVRAWIADPLVHAVVLRVREQSADEYAVAWNRWLPEPDRDDAIAAWTRAFEADGVRRIQSGVIAVSVLTRRANAAATFHAVDAPASSSPWRAVEALLPP